MNIPDFINIAGRKIQIIKQKNLVDSNDCLGLSDYEKNIIRLQSSCEGKELSTDSINATFLHEIVHWIFYVAGERELKDNEKLADSFSELLYQVVDQIK